MARLYCFTVIVMQRRGARLAPLKMYHFLTFQVSEPYQAANSNPTIEPKTEPKAFAPASLANKPSCSA
ncbi:hypothetical protein [Coleofasciculus sp. G2-EDA-02]|uniref:hypothetical protein n=1 Tax=Coleofasciculus sp. G2-EDA-02 TaxID=3069529 RepID=UPI0032FF6058